MYRLGNEFKKFALIVYENDSKDNTLNLLKAFSHKYIPNIYVYPRLVTSTWDE